VLSLIATTRKTGELRVTGTGLEGSVWLDAGQVVEAAVGKAPAFVDALFDLLRLKEGTFSFEGDRAAPHPGVPAAVEPIVEEAQARLVEWRDIEAVIPSLDHVLELIAAVPGPVTLRNEQWPLVVALAANQTPRSVLDALVVSEFEGCKALKELADAGLMSVAAPAPLADKAAGPKPEVAVEARREETPGVAVMETALPDAAASAPARPATSDEPATSEALAGQLATLDGSVAPKSGRVPAGTRARPAHIAAVRAGAKVTQAEDVPAVAVTTPTPAEQAAPVPASTDPVPEPEAADAEPVHGEEPINRGLLLKFLSSVRS